MKMGYDNVILQIGKFGVYQRRILLVLFLPVISWAFMKMGGVFLAAKPDFRCLLPHESPDNATYDLIPNITNTTYPWDYGTKNWRCERYDTEFANLYHVSGENLSSTPPTVKCDSFVYDKTQYTRTVTTEWDLVCDNAWLRTMGDSLFMLGDVPGVLIIGGLSDKYGRKLALLIGVTIQFVCGVLVAFSPNFIAYTIFRVLVGTTISGVYLVAYVSVIEMVSTKNRIAAATSINVSYVMGYILVAGLAYFITNWRTLQLVFTIPSLAFLIFSRYVRESVLWLMTKGRVEEAKDIVHRGFLGNGVELSRDTIDVPLENNSGSRPILEKTAIFDILRNSNLRKKTLLLFFLWFVISLTYYGLSWNTSNLGGNDYLNFEITAAVELPAYIFVFFTINRWGRKPILCGGFFLSGISLILTYFVPLGMSWMMVLLSTIGKAGITVCSGIIYVFTAEQYPTPIRNVGAGACSSVTRLGGVLAPCIGHLFEISTYLPLVMLGSSTLVAGLLALFLPETLNEKLPDSVQESEQLGKTSSQNKRDIEKFIDVGMTKLSKE